MVVVANVFQHSDGQWIATAHEANAPVSSYMDLIISCSNNYRRELLANDNFAQCNADELMSRVSSWAG